MPSNNNLSGNKNSDQNKQQRVDNPTAKPTDKNSGSQPSKDIPAAGQKNSR